ncbi:MULTISPECIES: hypothetical protein [Bacillus]|uniref:hypothetical protein n=1 Tax=Bacillus TaxID=1386 RepID=UPI00119FDC99|nr:MULTISPECIES: hypothetical protein [Bacillus]
MSWNYKKRRKKKIFLKIGIILCIVGFICMSIQFFTSYKRGNITITAPFALGTYAFDKADLSQKELDIAWKLYVQLNTRKAAIPIDENNDIITDIYSSWYELFKITREYLLELSAKDLEGNDNAQQIVQLSIDVLNKGLRPHLTEWQGKYKKWYDEASKEEENKNLTPQEIQKKYPQYNELVTSMKDVNKELMIYSSELKKFSHEQPANLPTKLVNSVMDFFKKFT